MLLHAGAAVATTTLASIRVVAGSAAATAVPVSAIMDGTGAVPFVGGAAAVAGPGVGGGAVPFFGPADDGTDGRAVGHAPLPA